MFSFFKKKPPTTPTPAASPAQNEAPLMPAAVVPEPVSAPVREPAPAIPAPAPVPSAPVQTPTLARKGWIDKLKHGLRKTGSSIATVFTGTRIDEALYEDLEAALLMADTGVKATQYLLDDLKRRVKESKATDPSAVKGLLIESITSMLLPLE
ncbi:MAG TPA: signal recognition particle receptor subunit alpha, partial [Rhodoferax sp.]|nr:signal recognition particle receptor subunit alpha [Rhodoferax sp.]